MNNTNLPVERHKEIILGHFPKKLKQLGKYLLENEDSLTIAEACERLELNKDSIYTMITRCRRKGNDFSKLINDQLQNVLHENKLRIGKSLVKGAVSGSYNHQKLYFQLTGDLKEDTNITVNNLTIGINISGARSADTQRPKGTIDVTPIIPDDD